MAEDLVFQIQLGLILPKFKEKLTGELSTIVEDICNVIKAGAADGEALDIAAVKDLIMKDFEIFIDKSVLPEITKKFAPPATVESTETTAEGSSEQAA